MGLVAYGILKDREGPGMVAQVYKTALRKPRPESQSPRLVWSTV